MLILEETGHVFPCSVLNPVPFLKHSNTCAQKNPHSA